MIIQDFFYFFICGVAEVTGELQITCFENNQFKHTQYHYDKFFSLF